MNSSSGWVIIGLGNPGDKHKDNRHNVGFMAIEKIAQAYEFSPAVQKKDVMLSIGKISGNKITLMWPMSYMNLSGEAASPIISFYKIPLEKIIIIQDDLDLECGTIRIKQGGGSGGHNGIKNIDHMIGKNYWRIRIGIGHPGDREYVASYVLSNFLNEEIKEIDTAIDKVSKNICFLLDNGQDAFKQAIKK